MQSVRWVKKKANDEILTKNSKVDSVGRSDGFEETNEILGIGVEVEAARQKALSQPRR
jgi:hypothetical protein